VTDNKLQVAEFENPFLLLVEKKVSSLQTLVPILEQVGTFSLALSLLSRLEPSNSPPFSVFRW